MFKKIIVALFIVASFAGCLKESKNSYTTTCNYDACAVVAPAAEIQTVKTYLDSAKITATQHCSGLFYVVDTLGTGNAPTACSTIAVTYKGTLTNGTVFDQGPLQYPLSSLITGWKNGLPQIKEGGRIRLFIPPTLGYGNKDVKDNSGKVVIPANSVLIFDIKLLGVQ